jgi:hypothetical protein
MTNSSDPQTPECNTKMYRHAELSARAASGKLTPLEGVELAVLDQWLDENLPPPGNSVEEKERYTAIKREVDAFLRMYRERSSCDETGGADVNRASR